MTFTYFTPPACSLSPCSRFADEESSGDAVHAAPARQPCVFHAVPCKHLKAGVVLPWAPRRHAAASGSVAMPHGVSGTRTTRPILLGSMGLRALGGKPRAGGARSRVPGSAGYGRIVSDPPIGPTGVPFWWVRGIVQRSSCRSSLCCRLRKRLGGFLNGLSRDPN